MASRWVVHEGDCVALANEGREHAFDAIVCDPPYDLVSITKRFGKNGSAPAKFGSDGRFQRLSGGFMGQKWDSTGVAFKPETWAALLRVVKPGAHLIAFGGTRTYHRMACAVEDAGWEIRDALVWLQGQGFPKSHNLDGAWEGWGTALKPAWESIVLARAPLSEPTIAANVLKWGTGAINVDGCRIEANGRPLREKLADLPSTGIYGEGLNGSRAVGVTSQGRWPANVVLDEHAAMLLDEEVGERTSGTGAVKRSSASGYRPNALGTESRTVGTEMICYGDTGGVSRFFYTSKASASERKLPDGTRHNHPTTKPLSLMRWLVRLVTPPNGIVLDPFCGSGSTGVAALQEGFRFVGIDMTPEYCEIARKRLAAAEAEKVTA